MTTLETRIYSHPPFPPADISPLEVLILTNVLECSETEEGLVLFTDVGPTNPIRVRRGELVAAFGASARNAADHVNVFIADRVLALLPAGGNSVEDDVIVEIDLSHFPWQFVVQGIVARSPDLQEVAVIQWTNHPSQRPDSFGASVSLITAKAIHHATSEDLLDRFRLQDKALRVTSAVPFCRDNRAPAGSAASDLFAVKEIEMALCLWEAMLYFRGLHQDERPVPETIAQMSELWDAVGWQEMRSHVREIVPLALAVYDGICEELEDEGFTFDFDFAPAFVETLCWSENAASREGEPGELREHVMAAVRRHRQDVVARHRPSPDPAPCHVDR